MGKLAGWLGMMCLGLCAVPLVIATVRAGNADSVDPGFLGLWLVGEISMLWHVLETGASWPVKLNYIANAAMVSVIGYYRWL